MQRTYADIDGYRLEVGPGWHKHTASERAQICNGVGGESQPQWQRDLLGKLPYLTPAAKPHDIDYHDGGGSAERLEADRRFRRNCFIVAKAKLGPWWKRLFRAPVRARWLAAVLLIDGAYAALRAFGRANFNYAEIEDKAIESK